MERPAIVLADAVLCPTCDVIYVRRWPCPQCASTTGLDLARVLVRRAAIELLEQQTGGNHDERGKVPRRVP